MTATAIKRITLYPLAIPMRRTVSHATSRRTVADPLVVAIELMGGTVGYGETLPRPYVTGETIESVLAAIQEVFAERLLEIRPSSFTAALEAAESLPFNAADGTPVPAARAAVELALLDAHARWFGRSLAEIAGWAGWAGFGPPGSTRSIRYSGVLASEDAESMIKTLRRLWWFGLRDFKLKVGDAGDSERLARAYRYLRRPIARGRASLRVDANGAWTKEEAIARLADWRDVPLAGVEQPLPRGNEDDLPVVQDLIDSPIIHDESLITFHDAERLHALGVADGFNIRISKCGGLLPALRLATFARRHGGLVQLGCMVGETSILSAAGWRFLQMTPGVTFAEGCFGSFLLRGDVVSRPLRFGFGGRGVKVGPVGLGVDVAADRLAALCPGPPTILEL